MNALPLRRIDFLTRLRWRWFHRPPAKVMYYPIAALIREWGHTDTMLERRNLKNMAQRLIANHIPLVARFSAKRTYLLQVKPELTQANRLWVTVYQLPKGHTPTHRGSLYAEGELVFYYQVAAGTVTTVPYASSHAAIQSLPILANYPITLS